MVADRPRAGRYMLSRTLPDVNQSTINHLVQRTRNIRFDLVPVDMGKRIDKGINDFRPRTRRGEKPPERPRHFVQVENLPFIRLDEKCIRIDLGDANGGIQNIYGPVGRHIVSTKMAGQKGGGLAAV